MMKNNQIEVYSTEVKYHRLETISMLYLLQNLNVQIQLGILSVYLVYAG